MNIEQDWTTMAGLRAVIVIHPMGHRCGYVGVPKGNQYYGKDYDDVDVNVHGGLTYSQESDSYPVESDLYWFGFDCAHYMDRRDPNLMDEKHRALYESHLKDLDTEGVIRSMEYCEQECENLANQLKGE